ncbi:MAG TPA: TetR/AcrR family transcriptional regulator [Polyangiales bacterium]|nr:TetR/AcrR family transcriptional regulator [Polyangiales bacterium]
MRSKLLLSPKKQPSTPRGQETYQALVTATARLLERGGYEALTTNHVAKRAGVGVASVYEFFPSKHALVAAVVDVTVESVLSELTADLEYALAHSSDPIAEWIRRMFAAIAKRKRLFSVLVQEVPFFWQVPSVLEARAHLHALSLRARALTNDDAAPHVEAMTYLMPIMVAHAVLDSVIRPPQGLEAEALERALIDAVKRLVL